MGNGRACSSGIERDGTAIAQPMAAAWQEGQPVGGDASGAAEAEVGLDEDGTVFRQHGKMAAQGLASSCEPHTLRQPPPPHRVERRKGGCGGGDTSQQQEALECRSVLGIEVMAREVVVAVWLGQPPTRPARPVGRSTGMMRQVGGDDF